MARIIREERMKRGLSLNLLAEAASLGCSVLLTSDEHLRAVDFERLRLELATFDLAFPVIATPREIVRKFFR